MCEDWTYDFDCEHRAVGDSQHCDAYKANGVYPNGAPVRRYHGARNGKCPACNYPTPPP